MKKFIIAGAALVALAAPSVAMASQPATPGGFGTERADNIATYHTGDGYGNWGSYASDRAGTNGDQNQQWMADHGFLPVESSLVTP
jgi:opacity protein-like surface antigen